MYYAELDGPLDPLITRGVIIKIHISNNILVTGQRREQWPSIEPTLGV